ncbi:MAG: DUF1350 family protein, partial [Microcystis panniformis]
MRSIILTAEIFNHYKIVSLIAKLTITYRKTMTAEFKFIPLQFNWVAINPKPIGVVYFIGGAFFGTFPNLFYRYLLKQVF